MAQRMDRWDARMLQLGSDLRFFQKSPRKSRFALMLGQKHLDGQSAAEIYVLRLKNVAHAAAAEAALDLMIRNLRPSLALGNGRQQRRGQAPQLLLSGKIGQEP